MTREQWAWCGQSRTMKISCPHCHLTDNQPKIETSQRWTIGTTISRGVSRHSHLISHKWIINLFMKMWERKWEQCSNQALCPVFNEGDEAKWLYLLRCYHTILYLTRKPWAVFGTLVKGESENIQKRPINWVLWLPQLICINIFTKSHHHRWHKMIYK